MAAGIEVGKEKAWSDGQAFDVWCTQDDETGHWALGRSGFVVLLISSIDAEHVHVLLLV